MKIEIPVNSDFSIHNIPFGIFSTNRKTARVGVAIGDHILDLKRLSEEGIFKHIEPEVFAQCSLNKFIALGKEITSKVRTDIQALLLDVNSSVYTISDAFTSQKDAVMHLPVEIGDYTDFYSSIEHATNVGMMFRDPENALLPNWKHLPVGYHGRASSIIVSGQNIHRPKGQTVPKGEQIPQFGPSRLLDFELETAFIVGKNTQLGDSISTGQADDFIFGIVLFNDWSARDIQKWEYVPLGPFLGKSFASSISPWIVTMEALEPFRVPGPKQDPAVLEYLSYDGNKNYDIKLQVGIQPLGGEETTVSNSNFKYMYWNMCQQLAHHTVNGCNVRIGDMMGSGTLSGPDQDSLGSMLEISWAGSRSVKMKDGTERKFIQDNDTVIMRGYSEKGTVRVGFGEVRSQLLPAKQ